MTAKSLKRFTEILKRNEGLSLIAIVALMVIMAVMGGVFSQIMGRWKLSAPATINSTRAYYLAETAAMFALQDAKYRFFSKDAGGCPDFPACESDFPASGSGTRSSPYIVSSSSTETAEFWIERPYPSANTSVDEYPTGTDRGNNDDDTSSDDDDVVDDDLDDNVANNTLYTIIATGKVIRDGTTVAKRQIKIKATITSNISSPVAAGLHAEGSIRGSGVNAFQIWEDGRDVDTDPYSVAFSNGTYADSDDPPSDGSRDGVVYQPPVDEPPDLDEEFFKVMAAAQGHYNPTVTDGYPGNNSYYYDTPTDTIPNIIYISGDLSPCNNKTIYGIYWIKGDVSLGGNFHVDGIIICEGDIKLNAGGGTPDPHLNGGIIQYGSLGELWAAGNPTTIQIKDAFFDALNATIPIITVQSWQEAVSAN
ncbi:MAG: hypothetical protein ACUZ8N_11705 [Candidatus Scalindua sp.]